MCRNRLPPSRDVQQLHADADAEHRHATVGRLRIRRAVEFLAARFQRADRGVQHEAVAARIEVGSADQHHAVQQVEHAVQIVVLRQRRHDHRHIPRPTIAS